MGEFGGFIEENECAEWKIFLFAESLHFKIREI